MNDEKNRGEIDKHSFSEENPYLISIASGVSSREEMIIARSTHMTVLKTQIVHLKAQIEEEKWQFEMHDKNRKALLKEYENELEIISRERNPLGEK